MSNIGLYTIYNAISEPKSEVTQTRPVQLNTLGFCPALSTALSLATGLYHCLTPYVNASCFIKKQEIAHQLFKLVRRTEEIYHKGRQVSAGAWRGIQLCPRADLNQ